MCGKVIVALDESELPPLHDLFERGTLNGVPGIEMVGPERIKELAKESGVPMVENRPLARALLKNAKVGTMIPYELYMAVAEVLAFVLRTRGKLGASHLNVRA